ncbi:hypothetical protein HYS82_02460 [Candidatus Amesbacteria bacterium]|nr:hypothetical protein [Candidatus Amesbacteria bacterium]MBI2587187.1 hypothetical protein [Candidatus Amesbacteria bacterium]
MYNIQDSILNFSVWGLVKWMMIGGMVFYCVFAVVLVMQVKVMTETFESGVNSIVKFAGVVHLVLAILLTAGMVVIL